MSNILVPLFLPFTFRDDSILIHSSKNKATVQGILGENVSRNVEFFFFFTKIEYHSCFPSYWSCFHPLLDVQLSPSWWVRCQPTKLGRASGNSTLRWPPADARCGQGRGRWCWEEEGCLYHMKWRKDPYLLKSRLGSKWGLIPCPLELKLCPEGP